MTDLVRSALHAAGDTAAPGSLPPPDAVRARGRQRTRRTTLAAGAGAVLAGSVVVLLARPADGPAPAPAPAPSPSMTTPSPSPTAPELTEGVATRLTIDTGDSRFSAQAIAVRAGRFVVVGDSSVLTEEPGPPVYWSDDGVHWEPPDGPPLASVNVTDVVATDSGFVAVGIGPHDAAAWRSTDGRTWTPVPVEEPVGPARSSMWGVSSTRVGLFASGFHDGRARLWHSADGSSWALVADPHAFDVPGRETICTVRDAPGGLVATGVVTGERSRAGRTVTWASADGTAWSRTDDGGERALWCDSTRELGHWEARNDVVQVRIEPYGPGDVVEVTVLAH